MTLSREMSVLFGGGARLISSRVVRQTPSWYGLAWIYLRRESSSILRSSRALIDYLCFTVDSSLHSGLVTGELLIHFQSPSRLLPTEERDVIRRQHGWYQGLTMTF